MSAFIKVGGSIDGVYVLFLSGDYAGYWYHYVGGNLMGGYNIGSVSLSVGYGKSLFYGWTTKNDYYDPSYFQGSYMAGRGNFEIGIGVASIGVFGAYTESWEHMNSNSPDTEWKTIHLGAEVEIGLESFGPAGGILLGPGGIVKTTEMVKTQERSAFRIFSNWAHFLFTFVSN